MRRPVRAVGALRDRARRIRAMVRGRGERGTAIVEFSITLPIMMLIMLTMLEFGFAFDHTLTIQYATREGARMGAALGPGTIDVPCATVDSAIVAAVSRVLESPGSRIEMAQISQIQIYRTNSSTSGIPDSGFVNTWVRSGSTWVASSTQWNACARNNTTNPPDSIGVAVAYAYRFRTPLGGVLNFLGGPSISQLAISDKTVMALNPQN